MLEAAARCAAAAAGMVFAALIRPSQNTGPRNGPPFVPVISAFRAALLRMADLAGMNYARFSAGPVTTCRPAPLHRTTEIAARRSILQLDTTDRIDQTPDQTQWLAS